jgi:hypothetical protein
MYTAFILKAGQSTTGSFNQVQVLASGSSNAYFSALKDYYGNNIASGSLLQLPAGSTLNLIFTSASLDSTSAPVLVFTNIN